MCLLTFYFLCHILYLYNIGPVRRLKLKFKSNVRLPKERGQQECNAGPKLKVNVERVEVRGGFARSGTWYDVIDYVITKQLGSQRRRPNQERLGPGRRLHDAVHYSVGDKG